MGPETPPELGDCLARLAAGDSSAADRIIELCQARLRRLTHRMLARFPNVRRWDDTDDVMQNASLRLHRALVRLRPGAPRDVLALAATQVRRELLDLARRHAGPQSQAANHGTNVARGMPTEEPVHHVDRAAAPPHALDRWRAFHDAIDALPPEEREVFHLVWYLGSDQATAAALLGCSSRTVRARWRAAREAVRTALAGRSPEADDTAGGG